MTAVITGLEVLLRDEARMARLRQARVGLLVNPTSVTADLVHSIEALIARGVNLVRLFGPEHGVRAEAQDMEAVSQSVDALSGLPVVSLYGHDALSLEPTPQELDGLDVVICDIQDIGTRYYTYAYTIGLMMKACGAAGVSCWVLDRPNPLGGEVLEGNVVLPELGSFVGMQPLATRHAMTLGELTRFFDRFCGWSCELEVIAMQGWRRHMRYDQTGVPWVMPSPNMPTLETALLYPGQCLLEGTNLSEGRGTTRPFELFGAPYLDAPALYKRLSAYELPGVAYRVVSFKPMFQKHAGQLCRGLQLHITDAQALRSLTLSLCILSACLELSPEDFGWREQAYEFVDDQLAIDLLLGDSAMRVALEDGIDPREVADQMALERAEFEAQRAQCLLYD